MTEKADFVGLSAGFRGYNAAEQFALCQVTHWPAGFLFICPATVSSTG